MQKEPSPTLDRTACNCLALRQAARHVSQIYDSYVASEGLRTTQYSILAKLNRLGPLSINELAKLPFCFRFPPTVAGTGSSMRPMPDSDLPALCDHCIIAKRAFAREASLSSSTFSFNDSEFEFHLLSAWARSLQHNERCNQQKTDYAG